MSKLEPLKLRFTKYILFDPISRLAIGIDRGSGGIPFETNCLDSIEKFNDEQSALDFRIVAKLDKNKWGIREMEVRIK